MYVMCVVVGVGGGDKATQLFTFLPRFCMVKVHFLQKKNALFGPHFFF